VRIAPITRVTIHTKNSKIPNQTGQQILFLHGLHLHKVPNIPTTIAKLAKAMSIAKIIVLKLETASVHSPRSAVSIEPLVVNIMLSTAMATPQKITTTESKITMQAGFYRSLKHIL
jgi:hypothetical protein